MIAKLVVLSCAVFALASCNKNTNGSGAGGSGGRAVAPC